MTNITDLPYTYEHSPPHTRAPYTYKASTTVLISCLANRPEVRCYATTRRRYNTRGPPIVTMLPPWSCPALTRSTCNTSSSMGEHVHAHATLHPNPSVCKQNRKQLEVSPAFRSQAYCRGDSSRGLKNAHNNDTSSRRRRAGGLRLFILNFAHIQNRR